MNTDEQITVSKEGWISVIRLRRPDGLNILNTPFLIALGSIISGLENDSGVRAVIITGEKNFCAGADIRELREKDREQARAFAQLGQGVFSAIEKMSKPVIAAVSGYALGGGCELALACDIRLAAEDARFGLTELNLGIILGFGGTQRLTRLVGAAKARELILTARIIGSEEAGSIGLVNGVVKTGELMTKAMEMAGVIAEKSPLTVQAVKKLISAHQDIREGLEMEISSFADCFSTEDRREGLDAFLEKRKPTFRGN